MVVPVALFSALLASLVTTVSGQGKLAFPPITRMPRYCQKIIGKSISLPVMQATNTTLIQLAGLKSDEELFHAQSLQLRNILQKFTSAIASFSYFFAGMLPDLPSGDFIDVTVLSDDRFLIRFGDVMGHGRPAADISFTLQKILHSPATATPLISIYEQERGLFDAVGVLETLFQYRDPNFVSFYTMTSTIVDPATRTITSLFSGSDPFFRVRITDAGIEIKKIYAKEATTAVVSLDTEVLTAYDRTAKFTPLVTPYQSGDILIYMSDGVLTRASLSGKYLSDHPLLEQLIVASVAEGFDANLASRLHALILENTEDIMHDDTTIFAVKLP